MPIAFDAATDGGNNGGSGNLTFAHTCTGADRVLLVGFDGNVFGGTDFVTGVTYNGVAMTAVSGTLVHASLIRYQHLYLLINPASGTHNVVISISSAQYLLAVAASYTGCLQTGQPNAVSTAVGGTGGATSTVTTTLDNCWLAVSTGAAGFSTQSGTPPATHRVHDAAFTAVYIFDSNGPMTPAGSHSLTTTCVGSTHAVGHILVAIAPIPGGGETAVASADFF